MADASTRKRSDEVRPGDIVMFLGTPHLIARIDPPAPDCPFPWVIGYARASNGWGITLAEGGRTEVAQ